MAPVRFAEIKDLHAFLEKHLKNAKVLNSEVTYLTSVGDNYGSETLKIIATVQWTEGIKAGSEEVLHLVGKQPPKNELFYEWFQPQLTCHKENQIYLTIAPALEEFQLSKNVPKEDFLDVFAKFYGCRASLDESSDTIDLDALLVLENLYAKDYKLGDRMTGFDEKSTECVMKSLAKYHALPIAIRYLNPLDFRVKFQPHLKPLINGEDFDYFETSWKSLKELLKTTDEFSDDIHEILRLSFCCTKMPWHAELPEVPEHRTWNSVVHRDLWVNNLMIRYDKDNNPIDMKLLDFQIYSYNSVMLDILFFLFTSTDYSMMRPKFYDFLRIYYDQFIRTLTQVGCPTKDFSFESFIEEMKEYGPHLSFHIITMLRAIMAKKESLPETNDEINMETFMAENLVDEDHDARILESIRMMIEFNLLKPLEYYKKIAGEE